jgi:hypothetical protein
MKSKKLNVGLVIMLPVKDSDQPLAELEKFTLDQKAGIILFPEDHIYSDKLPDLQRSPETGKNGSSEGRKTRIKVERNTNRP